MSHKRYKLRLGPYSCFVYFQIVSASVYKGNGSICLTRVFYRNGLELLVEIDMTSDKI